MKDDLGGKTMKKFNKLKSKTDSQLIDDISEDKKRKRHKNVCQKKA